MNLQPFSPAGETKTIAVSDTTGSVALTRAPGGAADLTVIVVNVGSAEAFVQFGASDVEATTSSTPIEPGQSMTFSVANTDAPYLAAITASSTTTLRATSGTGIPYGYGGGGSGGGGGGGDVNLVQVGGDPIELGPAAATDSLPVVFPTDGDPIPVKQADTGPITGTITTQNLVPTGTATAGSAVEIDTEGVGTVAIQVSGTYTGALSPQITVDGTTWTTVSAVGVLTNLATGGSGSTISSGATGIWQVIVNGVGKFRLTALGAVTGSAAITLTGAAGTGQVSLPGVINAASGSADVGNPIKTGGKYNATPPTLTDGQRGDTQLDSAGNTKVAIAAATSGLVGLAYNTPLTITRPANTTPYSNLDVVGGALTFPNMGPNAGSIMLTSSQLQLNISAIPSGMTSFFLALYNVTPPSALADNDPWDLPSGDRASFLGVIQLGTPVDLGSTLYVELNIINKQIKLAGTSLFAYLVTQTGYTPAANSEVYVATLHAVGLGL